MKKILLITAMLLFTSLGCRSEEEVDDRNCMTDPVGWYGDSNEVIQNRFKLYKTIGVNSLRVELSWRHIERVEDQWEMTDDVFRYMALARDAGFRIKLILGIVMNPPQWYFNKHPTACYRDQNGATTNNAISLWYPEIQKLIAEKSEKMIACLKALNLWDCVDYVVPALGSAGEPNYPPLWTTGLPAQTFWCYDDNAVTSFRTYAHSRYTSIQTANQVWDTKYARWSEVTILQPGQVKGRYWNDLLTWYRDVKRDYVRWTIDYSRGLLDGSDKKIVIYIPGVQYTTSEWSDAIGSDNGGTKHIMIMEDSDYLLDMAHAEGDMIQYTGLTGGQENIDEVARIRQYIDSRNYKIEVWGENVGDRGTATNYAALKSLMLDNGLYGLDYTKSEYLFEPDRVTPIPENVHALSEIYTATTQKYQDSF